MTAAATAALLAGHMFVRRLIYTFQTARDLLPRNDQNARRWTLNML